MTPESPFSEGAAQLNSHRLLAAQNHTVFMQARTEALRQAGDLIRRQIEAARRQLQIEAVRPPLEQPPLSTETIKPPPVEAESPPLPVVRREGPPPIWDEADLLEFAEGRIAPVFGPEYAIIDSYRRRVRLPTPPYLLVSRVTDIQGEINRFEPSTIQTEYDIPRRSWYTTDGQVPTAVAVESGQCDLLLISYLGIDFQNKGERVYRLLDCTLTFRDELPREGQTLRYDISINSFARSGQSLLFFFSYDCYVGDRLILEMRNGCAGFFSDEELAAGKGILTTRREEEARAKIPKRRFDPPLRCAKTAFDKQDLIYLSQGHIGACFGPAYDQPGRNPSLRLPPQAIQMIDRVVSVDPRGGAWGLGLIMAEKDLEPDHWYFPCHFKDDQVLAGSLVAEGCVQLMQFYLLYLGLQTHTQDARFQPIPDLAQVVRTRKQIIAVSARLVYRLEITEIGPTHAKANVDIILDGTVVVDFKDLGLRLSEKKRPESLPESTPAAASHKPAIFSREQIDQFAAGSVMACFGPEYEIYEHKRTPRTPNGPLQLISRVIEVAGERGEFRPGSGLVSEYDMPPAPWFYELAGQIPYSIYMELALQPCGFLSAYLGSTLPYPEEDFYFRNLDGEGHLLHPVEPLGQTITNRVRLLSATAIQGIIIQKFEFELACEARPFYRGSAAFGYFSPGALANQLGLDGGRESQPWYKQQGLADQPVDLHDPLVRQRLYQVDPARPRYHLAGDKLDFLDRFQVVEEGGHYGRGYIYARKRINPHDWFFAAHFYQDPVMAGSLGVEAILQAMRIYAMRREVARSLRSPRFGLAWDHQTVWKYRGQILPTDRLMQLEVHIAEIERHEKEIIITGQASLWRDNLRIYEVENIGLRLVES